MDNVLLMNDHGLDIFVGTLQALFMAMMVGPICYFILASNALKRARSVSTGRWKVWYALYASPLILLMLTGVIE